MQINKYQNYIFDFYGTLCEIWTNERKRHLWDGLAGFMKQHGAFYHARQLQKKYLEFCQREDERLRREKDHYLIEIDLADVFRDLYEYRGVKADDELIRETEVVFRLLSMDEMKMFSHAAELLRELRNDGKKVYLLSNAQAVFTEYEMQQLGMKELFDGICYSSTAGYRKPSERFFDYLFDKYKLKKEESIMIGNDASSDIKGAADYGIDSIYIHTVQSGKRPAELPESCQEYESLGAILRDYRNK